MSSFPFKKHLLFLSICLFSSCASKKENTLLQVLEAIEQDEISTIKELCTPKAFEQIEFRKSTFQSLLISDWDLVDKQLKCSEGEALSKCTLCDQYDHCSSLDYFKLRYNNEKWLVDYNEDAPSVVGERFLAYLEKMDFEAAKKIAGPTLRKKLKIMGLVLTFLKENEQLNPKELKSLRQKVTNITSFNPTLEWLKCEDDSSYPHTKICFLCNPLYGQTDKMIRVTQMKDKKWYVEYYQEHD